MLLNPQNVMTLAPVFVTLMRVIKGLYPQFSAEFQMVVDDRLCSLYQTECPVLAVDLNLAYFLQAFAGNRSKQKEEIAIQIYDSTRNHLLRRLIILIMSRWKSYQWLTDVKMNDYGAMSIFEKRAFIIASYALGDEGRHWREFSKDTWFPPEVMVRDWFAARRQQGGDIVV